MIHNVACRGQRIHFLETLHALAGRVVGEKLPADEEFTIHDRMVQRLPKVGGFTWCREQYGLCFSVCFPMDEAYFYHSQDEIPPKFSVADYYAALYVKTSIRGFLVRSKVSETMYVYLLTFTYLICISPQLAELFKQEEAEEELARLAASRIGHTKLSSSSSEDIWRAGYSSRRFKRALSSKQRNELVNFGSIKSRKEDYSIRGGASAAVEDKPAEQSNFPAVNLSNDKIVEESDSKED